MILNVIINSIKRAIKSINPPRKEQSDEWIDGRRLLQLSLNRFSKISTFNLKCVDPDISFSEGRICSLNEFEISMMKDFIILDNGKFMKKDLLIDIKKNDDEYYLVEIRWSALPVGNIGAFIIDQRDEFIQFIELINKCKFSGETILPHES